MFQSSKHGSHFFSPSIYTHTRIAATNAAVVHSEETIFVNANVEALRHKKTQAIQEEATLKGGDSAHLLHSHETLPEVLHAALQSPAQVGH